MRGRLAAVSVWASFGAGAWVGAAIGVVLGAALGALLAWFAGAALGWQRELAFTLGVTRALLPLGDQIPALRWLSSNWFLVVPAAALVTAAVTATVGGLIGALLAAAYNRSPRHASVVVELPDDPAEPAADLSAPEALVIDLDGTLVDTVETRIRSWLEAFADAGLDATRGQLAPMIGSDGRRLAREVAAAAGAPIDADRAEEIDRRAGEAYDALNSDPRPLPGAEELLRSADAAQLRWAIATSSRREQVGASVRALDLPRPPLIVDGSHVEHAKPAPDLMLRAAEELDVDPRGCWCIGDATWDVRAAVAAGMVAIGVTAGSAVDAAALREAGASLVVTTLDELIPLLEASQPPSRR